MDEKEKILRQIGWSDELIEKCLSPIINEPALKLPQVEYNVLIASDQDITNVIIGEDIPTTSDGTHLYL